jgi:DNA processing protein
MFDLAEHAFATKFSVWKYDRKEPRMPKAAMRGGGSRDRLALLALCRGAEIDWSLIARHAVRPGGLGALMAGQIIERRAPDDQRRRLRAAVERGLPLDEMAEALPGWLKSMKLTTVLDEDYPLNLRAIPNLPPFLFYRGQLREDDAYSVAVVGTRVPSAAGVRRARKMAGLLAQQGVTVLSGLARGIDTAAHEAALEAGGRTIAVLGSGLLNVYPAENVRLAERIAQDGAVVSQFFPEAPPAAYNFPRRNVVTSGMGQGTVVIEASATSGARMQARLALEHGKKVFLLKSLVEQHAWAKSFERRGALAVADVGDVLRHLRPTEAIRDGTMQRRQLAIQLV